MDNKSQCAGKELCAAGQPASSSMRGRQPASQASIQQAGTLCDSAAQNGGPVTHGQGHAACGMRRAHGVMPASAGRARPQAMACCTSLCARARTAWPTTSDAQVTITARRMGVAGARLKWPSTPWGSTLVAHVEWSKADASCSRDLAAACAAHAGCMAVRMLVRAAKCQPVRATPVMRWPHAKRSGVACRWATAGGEAAECRRASQASTTAHVVEMVLAADKGAVRAGASICACREALYRTGCAAAHAVEPHAPTI